MNMQFTGIHSTEEVSALGESQSAEAIREYLTLMEETESPRTFLVWSLISAAAGLIGRNAAFYSGPNHKVTPNLFIVLLGPSGSRKSSAINLIERFLTGTSLNLGPTDTGGQRHGIMSALTGLRRLGARYEFSLDAPIDRSSLHPRPATDMTFLASELGRLMGVSSREMADFLCDMWDGKEIDYQTKVGETRLRDPLINLLAATTPSTLASCLPDNAPSHGILSRMVFVFADKVHKRVPLPPDPEPRWYEDRERFMDRLIWIDQNRTDFTLAKPARETYNGLYEFVPRLEDPRLATYRERRPITLLKVAMALAALRNDTTIIDSDVRLAHELLDTAEPFMHRALEHFGRNRVYQGRMLILDYLRSRGVGASASSAELVAAAQSELNQKEALEAIQSMMASGELIGFGEQYTLGGAVKNEIIKNRMQHREKGESRAS